MVSLFLSFAWSSYSQWDNEAVDNGFDPKHKISTTKKNNGGYLKLVSKTVDEEKTIKDVKIWFDTTYKTKYYPEFPDGIVDTIINERREYKYEFKEVKNIRLSLIGGYHCEDRPKVEIVLVVGGENKKYVFKGYTYTDRGGVELVKDIKSDSEILDDFKKASKIKIRINEDYCEDSYYEFSMSGSTSAISFVSEE
tara:strand:- start:540 stop:1124 length:585 start_codon:yes stop_codon:yes gene_type:complete